MWKIFNVLFGWQYVLVPFAGCMEIARVYTTQTGINYYKIYGKIRILRESDIWMTLN